MISFILLFQIPKLKQEPENELWYFDQNAEGKVHLGFDLDYFQLSYEGLLVFKSDYKVLIAISNFSFWFSLQGLENQ